MDLVTFTEEILNGKLYFLCSAESFSNKVAAWTPATLLKENSSAGVSNEFCKNFEESHSVEHLRTAVSDHKTTNTDQLSF